MLRHACWKPLLSCIHQWTPRRVRVYSPLTQKIEESEVTDPYARSLAADGDRVQIVPPGLDAEQLVGGPDWLLLSMRWPRDGEAAGSSSACCCRRLLGKGEQQGKDCSPSQAIPVRCRCSHHTCSVCRNPRTRAQAPPGWFDHTSPRVAQWSDISLYELHVRDFRWVGSRRVPLVPLQHANLL